MYLFLALILFFEGVALAVPKAWERVRASYKVGEYHDGDSFRVVLERDQSERVVRLYFVDAMESDGRFGDRLEEQAAYFGIGRERVVELGQVAKAFTEGALRRPFVLTTRWSPAMGMSGMGRIYGTVETERREDLGESLVKAGLARIHGVRVATMANGVDPHEYLERLRGLEAEAKRGGRGGWGLGGGGVGVMGKPEVAVGKPLVAVGVAKEPWGDRLAAPGAVEREMFFGTESGKVFHQPGCGALGRVKVSNLVSWPSRTKAIYAGRGPCLRCKP